MTVAAAGTSLANGFAYDDVYVLLQDSRVRDLGGILSRFGETYYPAVALGGGGRLYRPLTMAGFTLEWAAGGGHPLAFHLVNLALYALAALLVFALARRFLTPLGATLAAVLFAVHPVHVEAVANVVGQAELLVAVPLLLAATLYVDGRRVGFGPGRTAAIAGLYLVGCLAKENAVLLPVLLLALEPAIAQGDRPRRSLEEPARVFLWLMLVAVVYLTLRSTVVGGGAGDLPHPLWRGTSVATRLWTMLGVLPTGLLLLLWPAHLRADYSPQVFPLGTGLGLPQLFGIGLIALVVWLAWVSRRRAPVVTAGILWAALSLAPVSNILLPTGVVLAERTLLLATVGVVLALGAGLERLLALAGTRRRLRLAVLGGVAAVAVAGLVRSAARQPVWKDNTTLFAQTIRDAPRSYWAWRNWGGDLVLNGQLDSAKVAYHRSLELFDRDPTVYDDLAGINRRQGHCDVAIPLLHHALALDSTRYQTVARLIGCLVTVHDYAGARDEARRAIADGQKAFQGLLVLVDSAAARAHR